MKKLFKHFEQALSRAGYIPRGGQIVDATLVSTPRQRMKEDERQAVKDDHEAKDI